VLGKYFVDEIAPTRISSEDGVVFVAEDSALV
jgi:hypothetical protein